jgi:L-ascorbate metabolism protein UlaG (beta-lactamase superfamily)
VPTAPLPALNPLDGWRTKPDSGLRATWLGHSTVLVEIDGVRVLTDPVWGLRASPSQLAGPKRFQPMPVALKDLPPIDAVLISHDHYDHLDRATLVSMKEWRTLFVCPLGVGAHLESWGIPKELIREVDWWERVAIGPHTIVATPARHASGRHLFDKDATLWASYAVIGPEHRVWFSGDTGLFPGMREIGEKLGPFDLTMIETGQYHRAWPDWHIGPEQAVTAHRWLRGKVFLPVHWGLFTLAYHGWTEPAERSLTAAAQAQVQILTPRPGESVEPALPGARVSWWPALPYETAEQHPIVSSGVPADTLPH